MPVLTRKRKREELRLDVWQNKDLRRCIFSFLPPAEGKCCLRYVESLPPLPYVYRYTPDFLSFPNPFRVRVTCRYLPDVFQHGTYSYQTTSTAWTWLHRPLSRWSSEISQLIHAREYQAAQCRC